MQAEAVSDEMLDALNPQYLQKNACGFFACASARNAMLATANDATVFVIVEFMVYTLQHNSHLPPLFPPMRFNMPSALNLRM